MPLPILDKFPFTIDNLPYGVIETPSDGARCAVAIGDHALDLPRYARTGRLQSLESENNPNFDAVFSLPTLNTFASLPGPIRRAVRKQIQSDLKDGRIPAECFLDLADVRNLLPMDIGGYSDFYTSLEHCQNCSAGMSSSGIFKNWWYAPSVYNGRISSVIPSGRDIHRPKNVYFSQGMDSEPVYGPTRRMDYELEMGYFVSKPVPFGERMDIKDARDHIFGFVLLNDWSARDHQLFEMRPLGPFHSKGFGTSISNWITPIEALEPFSCPPTTKQDPAPFPHLTWPTGQDGALNVKLRVKLVRQGKETVLGTSNLRYMYWTPYQQLTHHAASGCGMRTGDLIGTGTIFGINKLIALITRISGSGTTENGAKAELGCLYEAVQTRTQLLPRTSSGEYEEGYLEDGDEIVLEGWCEGSDGKPVLGFAECRGRIIPPE